MSAKSYCNGKIPALIWFCSATGGTFISAVVELFFCGAKVNSAFYGGLTRIFISNLIFMLPLFLIQAHFICNAIQKNKRNVMNVMLIILIGCWSAMFFIFLYWLSSRNQYSQFNIAAWNNLFSSAFIWILMSIFSVRMKSN